jgi:hypothetical protein
MAKDGDRHQLGDPISRIDNDHSVLADTTDPARLSERELRRQLANIDEIVQEAALRGTPPDIQERARVRQRELSIEHRRRLAATSG